MVRIIPDTNQLGILRDWESRPVIALPPCVLAEAILHSNFPEQHTIRSGAFFIGLEPVHALDEIDRLPLDEIPSFQPFLAKTTQEELAYLELCKALDHPTDEHLDWAREVKAKNLAFCGALVEKAKNVRRQILKLRSSQGLGRGGKYKSMEEALDHVGYGSDSLVGNLIAEAYFGGVRKRANHSREELIPTILRNPFFRRYFHTIVCFYLSISRLWDHEMRHLNFDPSDSRDDWTDVTISLYACPGDIILSADRRLRGIFQMVDPFNDVRVLTANELHGENEVA